MTPHDVKHLDGLLADLRRRDQADQPSPDTARVIMDCFASLAPGLLPVVRRPDAAPAGRPAAWRAAIAALGVASAAAWWLFAALPDRTPIAVVPAATFAPVAGMEPGTDAALRGRTVPSSERQRVPAPAAPPPSVTAERFVDHSVIDDRAAAGAVPFVALSPAPGAAGAFHLMRVQLPESAIWTLGLEPPASRDSGFVEADVLLGEDGVARAIRIIP